jgi:hypothetical protein
LKANKVNLFVHTATVTSVLTTKSTYRSLSAQRLSERTVYVIEPSDVLKSRKG